MWSESSLVIGYCFEAVTALPPVVVEFAREGEGTWGGVAMQDCSWQHKGAGDW